MYKLKNFLYAKQVFFRPSLTNLRRKTKQLHLECSVLKTIEDQCNVVCRMLCVLCCYARRRRPRRKGRKSFLCSLVVASCFSKLKTKNWIWSTSFWFLVFRFSCSSRKLKTPIWNIDICIPLVCKNGMLCCLVLVACAWREEWREVLFGEVSAITLKS